MCYLFTFRHDHNIFFLFFFYFELLEKQIVDLKSNCNQKLFQFCVFQSYCDSGEMGL